MEIQEIKKILLCLFSICIILVEVLLNPISVEADMGPKAEIIIEFSGVKDGEFYAALFSADGEAVPVTTGDLNSGKIPKSVKDKFLAYDELPGTYMEDIWKITSEDKILNSCYMPPDLFYLVVYLPEQDEFIKSGLYEKSSFQCEYKVSLSKLNDSDELVLEVTKSYLKYLISIDVILRLLSTILIESVVALLFNFRSKRAFAFVVIVNVVTQTFLNISLTVESCFFEGSFWGVYLNILVFFICEVIIFIVEAILYSVFWNELSEKESIWDIIFKDETIEKNNIQIVRKSNRYRKLLGIVYSIVANAASLVFGYLLPFIYKYLL